MHTARAIGVEPWQLQGRPTPSALDPSTNRPADAVAKAGSCEVGGRRDGRGGRPPRVRPVPRLRGRYLRESLRQTALSARADRVGLHRNPASGIPASPPLSATAQVGRWLRAFCLGPSLSDQPLEALNRSTFGSSRSDRRPARRPPRELTPLVPSWRRPDTINPPLLSSAFPFRCLLRCEPSTGSTSATRAR